MSQTLPLQVNKGTGQPVVLLHGLGTNYKSWTYVTRNLDYKRLHIFAFDLLGFGDAPKPDAKYTVKDHAEAVIKAMDKQGVKDAIVAGHSMGCLVALEVARQRPDLVKQLVLLGAPLYKVIPKKRWWKRLLHIEGVYFTIFNFLKDNPELTITAAKSADKFLPLVRGMEITEETWEPFRRSLTNTVMQTEPFKTACSIRTPTFMVYGLLDVFVSKGNLKKVARHNKRYMRLRTMLGPHEITPLQGKKIARLVASLAEGHKK